MSDLPLSLERWTRDFAEDTKRHSLLSIKRFERFTGMDADKFLAFAKSHDSIETLDLIKKVRDNFDGSVAVNFENHIRSFLRHNGVTSLPTSKNSYVPEDWHRGYKKDELNKLLGYLTKKHYKLFALAAIESGLRAQTILDIRYRHVQQDLEAGLIPVAIRLEPKFYNRNKSAGFTFLGQRSVSLLREMIREGTVNTGPDSPIIARLEVINKKTDGNKRKHVKKNVPRRSVGMTYPTVQFALNLARKKAGIDTKIQPSHGFRKYFEAALDRAGIDQNRKQMLEGHFDGTRSKHYTDREWDSLREDYTRAYAFIDPEASNPELEVKLGDWQLEKVSLENRIQKLEDQLQEEKGLWFNEFLKAVIEWGSKSKPTRKKAREFAEFLLEHAPDLTNKP
ncbi:MAG TPA: tyrosine-type recombinase/integrase [Candidatus Bathyarchaeia archaeon]|nr:tyrosine-type recombinase/integrase [Candidatus Bathyarchaeia archaeon]